MADRVFEKGYILGLSQLASNWLCDCPYAGVRPQPMPHRSPLIRCVNFPCKTAAFTFHSCQSGFAMLCWLALGSRLVCGFCSSARSSCLRFIFTSPHGFAVAFGSQFHTLASCRGLEPHKLTPMLGVHNHIQHIVAGAPNADVRAFCSRMESIYES